jgi:hypothetical protein
MFVDDLTFEKMQKEATEAEFGVVRAPVASMRHLIMLKIHAMKVFQEQRDAKDFSDLLFLVAKSKLPLQELKSLCETHASDKLFARIKGALPS